MKELWRYYYKQQVFSKTDIYKDFFNNRPSRKDIFRINKEIYEEKEKRLIMRLEREQFINTHMIERIISEKQDNMMKKVTSNVEKCIPITKKDRRSKKNIFMIIRLSLIKLMNMTIKEIYE
ncbi:MAG: hypothetical protein WBB67_12410 [bacterium]